MNSTLLAPSRADLHAAQRRSAAWQPRGRRALPAEQRQRDDAEPLRGSLRPRPARRCHAAHRRSPSARRSPSRTPSCSPPGSARGSRRRPAPAAVFIPRKTAGAPRVLAEARLDVAGLAERRGRAGLDDDLSSSAPVERSSTPSSCSGSASSTPPGWAVGAPRRSTSRPIACGRCCRACRPRAASIRSWGPAGELDAPLACHGDAAHPPRVDRPLRQLLYLGGGALWPR